MRPEMVACCALVVHHGYLSKKDGRKRPFYEISLEEWSQVMAVNLTGPSCSAGGYPHLARDGRASIVYPLDNGKLGASGPEGATRRTPFRSPLRGVEGRVALLPCPGSSHRRASDATASRPVT